MRRLYNIVANVPIIGIFLEVNVLIVWLCKIRLKSNYRNPSFEKNSNSIGIHPRKKAIINCRNFLQPEHSGVNVWIETICNKNSEEYQLTVLCQGTNLFSTKKFTSGNIEIKCLPIFKYLKMRKLPLHSSWMDSVNKEIAKIREETVLITPMNLAMPYGLIYNNYVISIVLLLTDERRHKNPTLTIQQIKKELKLTKRQKEIVNREKLILQNPKNSFIADSNAIVAELEDLYDVTLSSRTQVHYIKIPQDQCDEIDKERIVLFVGRCDKRKGLNIYLDVYEELENEFSDWSFIVATSRGDDEKTFKRLQNLRKKKNTLKILLNIKDEEKHKILNISSIALLPSYYESFGITGVEAMQHGCALISSRIGGIPEVVSDGGILVEVGSAQDFAQELRQIMLSEEKLIKLRKSAKLQVRKLAKQTKGSSIVSESLRSIKN
jgi:glycosyltransferase involved in cell wall biosynthesis